MAVFTYISHPNVALDPAVPVPKWGLNELGRSRMQAMVAQPWVANLKRVITSEEQKSLDAGRILADHLGLEIEARTCSGETDRSATGFVLEEEHSRLAALYFAHPEESARGWERSIDSQARIVSCVSDLTGPDSRDDVAVVGHGGVGTLLYCHLAGLPIAQSQDQPGMGHYWRYDLETRKMLHAWRAVDNIELA